LIGLLAIAGLTACGDKIEVPGVTTTPTSNVVRSVTVSPSSATLNQGDKITLAASVNADAGVTDRTVTWSSSNTAIASVDANGLVTAGTTAGNATITAASKADPTVKGAALITVSTAPGAGAPATVTISSVNQTLCTPTCVSVPANLANVAGQIDVTLNVEPGAQRLVGVDLVMNCSGNGNSGADTVVATQSLASASVAPEAEGASAPVTLSFNTATFNSTTGAPAFRNGQCTIKARARTNAVAGGAISTTTSTSQQITLNNQDVVLGSISSTKSAINPNGGLLWNGGDVTVTATPVLFSGRTPATMTITFAGKSQTVTGTGTKTATFTDGNGSNAGGATDIDGITNPAATATFTLVDAAGQPFFNPATCGAGSFCTSTSYLANPNAPTAIATIRLDTQKPLAGTFPLASNTDQGTNGTGYIGSSFRFAADSAAGYRGPNAVAGNQTANTDNGGVDNVAVTFQWRVTGASSSTYANVTNTAALNETTTNAGDQLRMITVDALGNADTTTVGTFGVDKTAPILTLAAGPANQAVSNTLGGTGAYVFTITDNLSGPAAQQLVAQARQQNVSASTFTAPAENTVFTTGAGPCVIGRYNATQSAASADALPLLDRSGTNIGFCSPIPLALIGGTNLPANASGAFGYITTRLIAVDQAGNRTSTFTSVVAEDPTAPTVDNIDMPATVTGNSSATFPAAASDNMDVTGSFAQINYATPVNGGGSAISLQYPTTAGPGVAFDNVLTRSATVNPVVPNFIKNLQVSIGGGVLAPTATGNATSVTVTSIDEANNRGSLTANFAPATQLAAGSTSTFSTSTFTNGFAVTASTATVSNCPAAGCGPTAAPVAAANATSTTLTATASGTTGTFTNPFSGAVGIWYQVGGAGPWYFAGNAAAGVSRDNGTNRFWDYTFSFDPPATAPDGTSLTPANGGSTTVAVRAIGVNSAGDAVATQPITITLTNP